MFLFKFLNYKSKTCNSWINRVLQIRVKKKSGNLYVELNKNKGRKEISVFAFHEIKGCELPYWACSLKAHHRLRKALSVIKNACELDFSKKS